MIHNKPELVTVVTTPSLLLSPPTPALERRGSCPLCGRRGRDARVVGLDRLRLTGSKLHRMGVQNLKIPLRGKIEIEVEAHGDIQTRTVYPNSYSPPVSIEAEANGNPVETNGEREPELVCTGISKGG